MGKSYFISDYHIGHANVMRFDERPFDNLDDMEKKLIEKWNNKVTNEDTVYCLGDMFWCDDKKAHEILKALKGKKILIPGNHTKGIKDAKNRKMFEHISDYIEEHIDGKQIIMSHYPIFSWKGMRYGSIHLYGHLHNTEEQRMYEQHIKNLRSQNINCDAYNVGCSMPYMNYEPQDLDTILEKAEKYYKNIFHSSPIEPSKK